ncbi:MAG: hypothetical protein EHM56_10050 [Chloroflexi bacterium]|nr:MAG: hypothetical protein EHM56_10050 [Chloroflexota bacterium]
MRKQVVFFVLAGVLLATMFGLIQVASGQDSGQVVRPQAPSSETQDGNRREVLAPEGAAPAAPLIGFIDSPTASCYQPDPAQDVCLINWYYMSVDAAPNYMITMTAEINAFGQVARYHGFFQTSMYVPFQANGRGFQVPCGALGTGGDPKLGSAYAWTIRARDSASLTSANYGTIYCPAFTP